MLGNEAIKGGGSGSWSKSKVQGGIPDHTSFKTQLVHAFSKVSSTSGYKKSMHNQWGLISIGDALPLPSNCVVQEH